MGKGGGAPTQTSSTVQNTNVPEYARPYVENMLGATQQQLFKMDGNNITGFQPYKAYGGEYDTAGNLTNYDPSRSIAGFSPLQEQAQRGIGGLQVPGEFGAAAGATQYATQRAMGANYAPSNYGNQFNPQGIGYGAQNARAADLGYAPMVSAGQYDAPTMDTAQTGYNPNLQNYQMGPAERVNAQNVGAQNIRAAQMGPAERVNAQNVGAQNIRAAQMGPAQQVRTQSFTQPGAADAYMSPYMQNVVDIQKREAQRQSGIQGTQQQAQATQAGAFGGSRDAIMRAERERNLGQQMGDIQAQGSQAAFGQAQQQFNAEQQARLAAQQSNQQAGLTVGTQNLNAQQQARVQNAANQLQASGMNAQQALQAALANQQAGLTTGTQNLNAQQQARVQNAANQLQASGMNAQQAMQAALANQQAGLTTGTQNLNAALGVQQLGSQTGLQTSLANLSSAQQANVQNQAARLQTQGMNAQQAMQAALANQQTQSQYGLQQGQLNQQTALANQAAQNQAGQFNAGQNLQAASLGAQYGQAANQLNEQSRQYGAGYGMQGLQTGLQGANQLASVGSQGLQAQQGIYGLQNQVGQQQQLNQQQVINQAMQDYANAQQYPLMQLGTMSNMLRGLPMQAQTTQQYQAQANPITQGIGAIGTLGSLGSIGKASGGTVKSMASGGITSIPRYDVGGSVEEQLANLPDATLKKEAMESPSQQIRAMAAAILKQRQAGLEAKPQAAEAPQGVGPMGVDYNANYAGGGIIAFATGETVDAEKAARLAKQTEMYVAGAKLAAEQRAKEAAAQQSQADALAAAYPPPALLDKNAPAYTGATGNIEYKTTASQERDRQRAEDRAALLKYPAGLADVALAPAKGALNLIGGTIPNVTNRVINALAGTDFKTDYGPGYNLGEYLDASQKGIASTGSGQSRLTTANDPRVKMATVPASGTTTIPSAAPAADRSIISAAPKATPKAAPKAGPAVVPGAVPAPPPLLDRNAPALGAAVEGAPAGIAAVPAAGTTEAATDPLAAIKAAAGKAQTEADKTQAERYAEKLAARKAQGLDNDEARQKYMQDMMAQKSNLADEANRTNMLRRAQFFAQWGSTPGNTLVAGMAALKDKIPDILQDAKDQKLALQMADKAIYDLGEATRLEKLGMFDEAGKEKQKAAETAALLQSHLATASASIKGHELSKEGTLGAAGISAVANVESHRIMAAAGVQGHQIMAAAQNYHTQAQMQANALSAQNTQFAQGSSLFTHANDTLKDLNNKLATVLNTGEAQRLQETIKNAAALPDNKLLQDQAKAATTALNRITKPVADAVVAQQAIVDQTGQRVFGKDWKTAAPAKADPLGLR